ncbi:MAG: carbamate kinase [Actinobacteria bacterium]|nr:carbamate kinase [Actinomycetota bacterium]
MGRVFRSLTPGRGTCATVVTATGTRTSGACSLASVHLPPDRETTVESDDRRVLVALGGNALEGRGQGGIEDQVAGVARTMVRVVELIADGWQVVLVHGNGPQVGDLVHRDAMNAGRAPAYPLDWAVAETQATIGHSILNALASAGADQGVDPAGAVVVSRVLVDADDPGFDQPTKPIGPYLDEEPDEPAARWTLIEGKGWRRVVASPQPRASLDLPAIRALVAGGATVVANGGGGIPTVRGPEGPWHGVAAVVDKDLAGAMLAGELGIATYVILTDVAGVAVDHGTDDERWLGDVSVADLRRHQADGQFPAGSMGPKVEAVCRFIERGGGRAAIGALDDLAAVLAGDAGTQVRPD